MRLQVGERFPGSGPASQPGGYVVTGVVSETAWSGLYHAKKIFYNFDFTGKRPRETDDKEWLDVYLRTIHYPNLNDAAYVAGRRALARAEVQRVLGHSSGSNLWPEPVDLLEVPNTRDPFQFSRFETPATGTTRETEATQELDEPEESAQVRQVGDDPNLEPICVFARPQGETLIRWQQTVLPVAAILSVLAELLDFLRVVHQDGLILNGLGPGTVLVDRAGRVHSIGTDSVVDLRGSGVPQADWGRFFPPERYPRGFSAPECFDPAAPRDRRADLYAWATLAYFLLTGERPTQLALEQGQPWACFEDAQLTQLERALRFIPPAHVRNWAEQLGVDPDGLARDWPRNLVTVFRLCVRPDATQRPASVADLRSWLLAPPPAPLAAVLALRLPGDAVRLFLDGRGAEPDVHILVRRGVGIAPTTADEGDHVSEGPLPIWVDDNFPRSPTNPIRKRSELVAPAFEALYYAVLTRVRHAGGVSSSVATITQVFEPTPTNIRLVAEGGEASGAGDESEPAHVALLFQALDAVKVAEALLHSTLPHVRGWAVRRLSALWRADPRASAAEALLWRTLNDPSQVLRLESAAGLIQTGRDGTATGTEGNLVRRVVQVLGGGNLEESLQAARLLRPYGVGEDLTRDVVAELEAERPAACPVCGAAIAGKDHLDHLQRVHGYLNVFGMLLPRADALERLWDRVFLVGDTEAHAQLLAILQSLSAQLGPHAYAAALQTELLRRASSLFHARGQEIPRLVRCLRQNQEAHKHFASLLRAADARVREVGRELLLPELGANLAGENITATLVRRQLDRVCPDDLVEEKILLGQRLPYLGIDAAAVKKCLNQLQAERPVVCSECAARVPAAHLDLHLRQVHRIYQFRDVRRPLQDTLAFLLDTLCGSSPDYAAWTTLEAITREEYATRADALLTAWLSQKLFALSGEQRNQAAGAAAEAMAASGNGAYWVPLLASGSQNPGFQASAWLLALKLAARLSPPVEAGLIETVKPLLSRNQVPKEVRQEAVAALLRTAGKTGPAGRELLLAYIAGAGKAASIKRLHQLEQHVGQVPAIDELCRELEDQLRMRCPRCATELRRGEMMNHLWDQHRLVLEGRRVREPWRLVEDWLEDYRLERDPAVLANCRNLVERLDPDHGPARLQRLLLQHGVQDAESRPVLLNQARQQRTSLCPHCFAAVPVPDGLAPAPLKIDEGVLEVAGCRVEVCDSGLLPTLRIETPAGLLFQGRQPDWRLTRRGALLYVVAPLVAVLLILTRLVAPANVPPLIVAAVAVGEALVLTGAFYVLWPVSRSPRDRTVDFAWTLLVPSLYEQGLTRPTAALVAGLARASAGLGTPGKRAVILEEICTALVQGLRMDDALARVVGAVWRLRAEDEAEQGEDPVPLLTEQAGHCFAGELPLGVLEELLARGETSWWKAGNRARLRVSLCRVAFEAGLEVADLVEVGVACPALAAAVALEDIDGLAQLRLLWALRQSRPWQRLGPTVTVFELADDPELGRQRLGKAPDLLLAVRSRPLIYLGSRGVWFEDLCLDQFPRSVEVLAHKSADEGGYHLVLGPHRFWFADDPDDLAVQLERCCRYYFGDFLPQAASLRERRGPEGLQRLRARNAVRCPQCRQDVLPRLGEMGVPLEEQPEGRRPARAL